MPDPDSEKELFELVKTFQVHKHSKTCRKYRNDKCRFNFGKFFTTRTIIAEPLPENMTEEVKFQVLRTRSELLNKVKRYIDSELNPSKINLYDCSREDYAKTKTIDQILALLDISKNDYEAALTISEDKDFHLFLKRPPNSCFVNNYFPDGLLAWEANLDIQPVFNHYKAVAYMCAYLSKSEDECSEAMNQAVKEAFEHNLDNYQQMKNVAHTYVNKRECSIQECVYQILAGQWLRKTCPGVIFANSNIPEKRYRICREEKDILQLPDDSTDIFKKNMIDRYIDRPNKLFCNGKYSILDGFCYAEFLRYYYLAPSRTTDNDYQPVVLSDKLIEDNYTSAKNYPATIPLMSSSEKLKCRKIPFVLKCHVPNRHTHPEEYAHHMLFLYFPFRNENELKCNKSYAEKLSLPEIINTVNTNYRNVEPFSTLVDDALERIGSNRDTNIDSYGQQENDEVADEVLELNDDLQLQDQCIDEDISYNNDCYEIPNTISEFPDSLINENRGMSSIANLIGIEKIKSQFDKFIRRLSTVQVFIYTQWR